MINSLFGDGTRSWVRIVNGTNKYVTERPEETHIEEIGESTGKPVAKARPKQTPSSMFSSTTVSEPCHERKWIDAKPGRFEKSCLEVSKLMIRLLRHDDTVPREDDGTVKFQELASIFRSEFSCLGPRCVLLVMCDVLLCGFNTPQHVVMMTTTRRRRVDTCPACHFSPRKISVDICVIICKMSQPDSPLDSVFRKNQSTARQL